MNARRRLIKKVVEALPQSAKRHQDHFDAELRGFHVRVWYSGERAYRLKADAAKRRIRLCELVRTESYADASVHRKTV